MKPQKETATMLGTIAAAELLRTEELDFTAKPPTKIGTILLAFVRGESLNRFDAQRHFDHCLNSTVSTLHRMGIQIASDWERVPCVAGKHEARVKRYRLEKSPRNIAAALKMLNSMGVKP
jgi:hypothetical protein